MNLTNEEMINRLTDRINKLEEENAELLIEKCLILPTCEKAVKTFGKVYEMTVAIEEMGELIQALTKVIRGFHDFDNVAEEIADVEICMEMMKHTFNNRDSVKEWKKKKISRLQKRIINGCDRGEGG